MSELDTGADALESQADADASDFREIVYKITAPGPKCPRCFATLVQHPSTLKVINSSQMFDGHGRVYGVPHEYESQPTLLPDATSAPAAVLKEWHRINIDRLTFAPGQLRCMDRAACYARAAAANAKAWAAENARERHRTLSPMKGVRYEYDDE